MTTPAQRVVLEKIGKYGGIMWCHNERQFFFIDGPSVNSRTVKCMLRDGLLRPNDDAMFDGTSQTFGAA